MRSGFTLVVICGLIGSIGCNRSTPAAANPPGPEENSGAEVLKSLEGYWLLKSSVVASERGTYSHTPEGSEELLYRIRDGVVEMSVGNDHWGPYATLAIGKEPNCLLISKADARGQTTIVKTRYKLEGNTLVMVQDNLYPDVLPNSFQTEMVLDRQRQVNTYVRTEQKR